MKNLPICQRISNGQVQDVVVKLNLGHSLLDTMILGSYQYG